ncbi:MAG: hypothetical protein HYS33_03215 [Acidobacteria bacterium]|nr:hypothetical protein [Acidobacteriota bacterium]
MEHAALRLCSTLARATVPWKRRAAALVLICAIGMPESGTAQCSEEPTILMDERTAESHLVSKKDLGLPPELPKQVQVRTVVLLVTVDREGAICEVKPVLGPKELQETAVKTVKQHWRYRRFLLDWKPVVAQFPVTVKFALPRDEPRLTAMRRALPERLGERKTI